MPALWVAVRGRGRLLGAVLALCGAGASLPPSAATVLPVVPLVTVSVSAATVPTAEFVWVTVTFDNVRGGGSYSVDYGDGSPGVHAVGHDVPCAEPSTTPTRHTETYRHAYRTPGRKVITARYTTDCGPSGRTVTYTYTGVATVAVTAGATPANGPEPVAFRAFSQVTPPGAAARRAAVVASFEDYDGWISAVSYRWGDGSRDTTFAFPLSDCRDPGEHWPSSRLQDLAAAYEAGHTYRRAGRHVVTVTVTSSGCDGREVQRGQVRIPLVVR